MFNMQGWNEAQYAELRGVYLAMCSKSEIESLTMVIRTDALIAFRKV